MSTLNPLYPHTQRHTQTTDAPLPLHIHITNLENDRLLRRPHVEGQQDVAHQPPGEAKGLEVRMLVPPLHCWMWWVEGG